MTLKIMLCSIYFLLYCAINFQMALSANVTPSLNKFSTDLQWAMVDGRSNENVIYSPASIQACMALAYLGAEGKTAQEMKNGLGLRGENKREVAAYYGGFVQNTFKSQNGVELKMANGIFVNDKLKLSSKFEELAVKSFKSEAQSMNFDDSVGSVNKINAWVERNTNSKIQNLLQPGQSINQGTSAVLVNAIYFKAKWAKQFSDSLTEKTKFQLNSREQAMVDMMYNDDTFKYAQLDNLDATALELPYENTDLTMLLMLPNKVDGLGSLESKLRGMDLISVASQLRPHDVDVFLPKFKIEFEVDLKKPLSELGISTVFSNDADLSSLFDTKTPQKISEARHKAYLEVNEAGSEAAAATFLKIVPMSLNLDQKVFRADHPFFFAIRNSETVFFAGHVAKF